ncbi:MAG: hypothetical protein U9Q83_05045, partial [Bacteroidota bacterium]|nr:hypothetical protein [Bacteroidota bacterium]
MKKSIIFLTILFITIISACNDNKWNSIKENATINSIQNFIDNNPENEHIQEAERILDSLLTIDSLNWRNALKENNIDSFYKYIEKNPEGKFIEKANKNIDFLKLIETNKKKQKTKDSLISIIKKYIIPNEETLGSGDWYPVWQKVIAKNNQSDYLSFLKTFQNSDNWSKAAAIIIYGTEYKDIVIKTFDFIVEMTENPSPENLSNFTKKPISVDKFCDDNLDKIEY